MQSRARRRALTLQQRCGARNETKTMQLHVPEVDGDGNGDVRVRADGEDEHGDDEPRTSGQSRGSYGSGSG